MNRHDITKKTYENQAFQYRCPACHYLVERNRLFEQGCPICGWISPLGMTGKLNAEDNSLHVDVVEDDNTIRITTELPLAGQNCIKLGMDGNKFLISSGRFNRIILLRNSVGQIIEKTYRNGVLEVKLKKTGR